MLSELVTFRRSRIHFWREFIVLKDGGLVSLDWARSQLARNERVSYSGGCCWIVVIVPGRWVCDSKMTLLPTCQALIDQEHHPLIWNQRGRAETPLTASGLPVRIQLLIIAETIQILNIKLDRSNQSIHLS